MIRKINRRISAASGSKDPVPYRWFQAELVSIEIFALIEERTSLDKNGLVVFRAWDKADPNLLVVEVFGTILDAKIGHCRFILEPGETNLMVSSDYLFNIRHTKADETEIGTLSSGRLIVDYAPVSPLLPKPEPAIFPLGPVSNHSDVSSTVAPSVNDILRYDGTAYVPIRANSVIKAINSVDQNVNGVPPYNLDFDTPLRVDPEFQLVDLADGWGIEYNPVDPSVGNFMLLIFNTPIMIPDSALTQRPNQVLKIFKNGVELQGAATATGYIRDSQDVEKSSQAITAIDHDPSGAGMYTVRMVERDSTQTNPVFASGGECAFTAILWRI